MSRLLLVLGNQLFPLSVIEAVQPTHIHMAESRELIEHGNSHKQKVLTCLSAMRHFADSLAQSGYKLLYTRIDGQEKKAERGYTDTLDASIEALGVDELHHFEIADHFFDEKLCAWARSRDVRLIKHANPMFMSSRVDFAHYLEKSKRPFMKSFYESQRRSLGLLMESDGKPEGGKYSFDSENRKKLPKDHTPLERAKKLPNEHDLAVAHYIDTHLGAHPGQIEEFFWPTTRKEALAALDGFISSHLPVFGDYQDSIDHRFDFIHHSLISSSLNFGLLLPGEVVEKVAAADAPLNCKEGFIRQVIGWREFVRGIYDNYSDRLYKNNHWGHHREMAPCWYEGATGIPPLDDAIKKAVRTGYNHHIERLMIIANLMNLCEIKPQNAYDWFMSFYVDSSDWVMAANVFGMGLMSDGGIFATKPYISGSNYILKMSSYKKGPWCEIWNALYWRFIEKNADKLNRNPRMGMIYRQLEKKTPEARQMMSKLAQDFLKRVTLNG